MRLILIRHAEAADQGHDGRDESRALTPRGRERFARAVRGLERLDMRCDRLLHSPMLRAIETAELLLPLCRGESEVCLELARDPGEDLLALLSDTSVALVGHEPWLSQLCAWLVTGDTHQARAFLFPKGGVAILEGAPRPGGMGLVEFLSQEALAELGR